MVKIIFTFVSIACLLILVMANTITTSMQTKVVTTSLIDWSEEETTNQTNPSPVEEDPNELDDETSKLISLYTVYTPAKSTKSIIPSNSFLTSFHFLEIISPPPQA